MTSLAFHRVAFATLIMRNMPIDVARRGLDVEFRQAARRQNTPLNLGSNVSERPSFSTV
jgi:hypothetical protein